MIPFFNPGSWTHSCRGGIFYQENQNKHSQISPGQFTRHANSQIALSEFIVQRSNQYTKKV